MTRGSHMKKIALALITPLLISPAFAEDTQTPNAKQETAAEKEEVKPQHAIALHGTPKYPKDFTHLSYVNPNAPQGGTLKLSAIGSFDSLNPFIVKGTPAAGMSFIRSGFIYESLMQNSWDEPFTLYGILAESIEVPKDKSWAIFNIRSEATWADGTPLTAHDVAWTFKTLTTEGNPFFKAYYGDIEKVEALSDKRVKFSFKVSGNHELPLIAAEMSILPKHYWTDTKRKFNSTSLEAPLGSGPYTIEEVEAGRKIVYKRRDNWWGEDLAFFNGFYNFERVQYDYYRDNNVALEAFFAGEFDIRIENTAKLWKQAYTAPAIKNGLIIKEDIDHKSPSGMQAFVYNIRRPVFQDIAVRKALAYAFDFEWSNNQFAYGDYIRTQSFYDNAETASKGLPEGKELEILERFRGQIPDKVFTSEYRAPATDGKNGIRLNLKEAKRILDEAGYVLGKDGVRSKGEIKLEFEILDSNPQFEKWVLPFIKNLERIGVKATFRVVDTAQYQNRMNEFDYDMTISGFGQSNSPGNEQRDFWGTEKADMNGSRNIIGVKDPVIDTLIEELVQSHTREDILTYIHAMDRILLHSHYVIPMWHYPKWRIARWKHIKRPNPLSDISPLISTTWWYEEE